MKHKLLVAAGLLGLATLSAVAFAQGIVGSKHDLSAPGGQAVRATTDTELCKFCHTPHSGMSTRLLWNHTQSGQAIVTWGVDEDGANITTTYAGTTLPAVGGFLRSPSRRCLGCHDGTVAVGDVANVGGGAAGTIDMVDDAAHLTNDRISNADYLVGAGGNFSSTHPVSIPYAAQNGYNGQNSAVPAIKIDAWGGYWGARVADPLCDNATGTCTNEATGNGVRINLIRDNAVGMGGWGIECTSCHEPHNQYGIAQFLRASMARSGLCQACHRK